jgi:hypothetical protein
VTSTNGRTDPRERLSKTQFRALAMFVRGDPVEEIVRRCGVSPVRVKRWQTTPRVRDAIAAEKRKPWPHALVISAILIGPAQAVKRHREAAKQDEGTVDDGR